MDTFGERLQSSREKKGYSLEQIARDTNIAKKYLIALEEEDFSIFPGDPYLIGFLKNYSEYLGLDPEEIVALHRNMKLQEQPVPIEELLDTGKSKNPVILLIIIVIIAAGVGGFFLFKYISNRPVESEPEVEILEVIDESLNVYSYNINTDLIEDRYTEGSKLEIIILEEVYTIIIKTVETNVIISLPGGEVLFNLGDDKTSDLNGDGIQDINIEVKDIDISKNIAFISIKEIKKIIDETENSILPEPGSSNIETRNQEVNIILEAKNPEPYIIDVTFRGNTLLRYLADKGDRVEQYFDKGETLRLDINREVMLWIANAGSFKARISGVEVNFGRSGEVSTQLIKWSKNQNSGIYELKMVPVY
jgi:cytoskeleton protein RodZ